MEKMAQNQHRSTSITSNFSTFGFWLCCFSFLFLGSGCKPTQVKKPKKKKTLALLLEDLGHAGWFDRTTKRIIKRGILLDTPYVKRCFKTGEDSSDHASCLLKVLRKANDKKRISILHRLFQKGIHGEAAILVMFRQAGFPMQVLLADHILAYAAHLQILVSNRYLKSYYNNAKLAFQRSFRSLGKRTRVLAAIRLTAALEVDSEKKIFDFFGGYLRFPATWLWKRIQGAREVDEFLNYAKFVECTIGRVYVSKEYKRGVMALHNFNKMLLAWKRATIRSNVKQYVNTIRNENFDMMRAKLPYINNKLVKKAVELTFKISIAKNEIKDTIDLVKNEQERKSLEAWFAILKARGPNISGPRLTKQPMLGVLVAGIFPDQKKLFGKQTLFLWQAAENLIEQPFFVLTPQMLSYQSDKETWKGDFFTLQKGQWVQRNGEVHRFYDRLFSTKESIPTECTPYTWNSQTFVTLCHDKLKTNELFAKVPLDFPQTVSIPKDIPRETLMMWLEEMGKCWFKPRFGAFGEDTYFLDGTRLSQSNISIQQLRNMVTTKEMLLQKHIAHEAEYRCWLHFLQKQWQITTLVKKEKVSQYQPGNKQFKMLYRFPQAFYHLDGQPNQLFRRLEGELLNLCGNIEQTHRGHEVAVDFLRTKDGFTYLELNSKPGRSVHLSPDPQVQEQRQLLVRRPFDALHTSAF